MAIKDTLSEFAELVNMPEDSGMVEFRDRFISYIADSEAVARNDSGKNNRLRIDAAKRTVARWSSFRVLITLAADLEEYFKKLEAPGSNQVHLKFDRKKIEERIAALPPGEDREYFQFQLENQEAPAPAAPPPPAPVAAPPPPVVAAAPVAATPPPPPAAPAPDPVLFLLEARLTELRAALEAGQPNKLELTRHLEGARTLAMVVADIAARSEALRKVDTLGRRVDQVIAAMAPSRPPFSFDPTVKFVTDKLGSLREALGRKDLVRARALFQAASAVAPEIQDLGSREDILSQLADVSARIDVLAAVPAAPVPAPAPAPRPEPVRPSVPPAPPAPVPLKSPETEPEATSGSVRISASSSQRIVTLPPALSEPVSAGEGSTATPFPREPLPPASSVLRLLPKNAAAATPIVFVARPTFLLGREPKAGAPLADYLTPKGFGEVGRRNVMFSLKGAEVLIKDGDEKDKSTNGTTLDGDPLPATSITANFKRERTIVLGHVFALVARHLPAGNPAVPSPSTIYDEELAAVPPDKKQVTGAFRFGPKKPMSMPVTAVWLLTDASIGTAPDCAVCLTLPGLSALHARIFHWRGRFWLENPGSGIVIAGGRPIVRGEAVPLSNNSELQLGQTTFDLRIEA